jgi:hypothetical protein
MSEIARDKGNYIKYSVFVIFAVLFTAISITLISILPASAEEKLEKIIEGQIIGEFEGLDHINFIEGIESKSGEKYKICVPEDKDHKPLGSLSFDTSTGEINSIYYTEEAREPGEPKLSYVDARNKAEDYLKAKNKELAEDYKLTREEVFSDWTDGLNRQFYQYQFTWQKCIDDALTFDCIYVTLDAGNGKILSWHKVDSDCPPPESKDALKPSILSDEAVKIVKEIIPTPEAWLQSTSILNSPYLLNSELEVKENVTKYYELIEGEAHLTWRVDIIYERIATEVAPNDEDVTAEYMHAQKRFTYIVDAKDGKVLYQNEYRDI